MGFHGGCETTLEDEIIYDEHIMPLIDEAEREIREVMANPRPVGVAPDLLRMKLETLVYKLIKWERGF